MARKNQCKKINGPKTLISDKNIDTLINKDETDQRRTCSKEAAGFLNIPTSFHKWSAAETHLADEEFLLVAINREEVSEIARKNWHNRDGQHFRHE